MVMGYGIISSVWFIRILFSSHLLSHGFQLLLFFLFPFFFILVFSQSRKSAFLFISLAGHWFLHHFFHFAAHMSLGFIRLFLHTSSLSLSFKFMQNERKVYKKINENNFKFNCLVVSVFFLLVFLCSSEILWSITIY